MSITLVSLLILARLNWYRSCSISHTDVEDDVIYWWLVTRSHLPWAVSHADAPMCSNLLFQCVIISSIWISCTYQNTNGIGHLFHYVTHHIYQEGNTERLSLTMRKNQVNYKFAWLNIRQKKPNKMKCCKLHGIWFFVCCLGVPEHSYQSPPHLGYSNSYTIKEAIRDGNWKSWQRP